MCVQVRHIKLPRHRSCVCSFQAELVCGLQFREVFLTPQHLAIAMVRMCPPPLFSWHSELCGMRSVMGRVWSFKAQGILLVDAGAPCGTWHR